MHGALRGICRLHPVDELACGAGMTEQSDDIDALMTRFNDLQIARGTIRAARKKARNEWESIDAGYRDEERMHTQQLQEIAAKIAKLAK